MRRVALELTRRVGRRVKRTSGAPGSVVAPWVALLIAACGGMDDACEPTEPLCPDTDPAIHDIVVTSPIDSVIAVGRTVTVTAEAFDETGEPVPTTFTWSVTNAATVAIDSSGTVTAQVVGTTTIQAGADGVVGELGMRAVDADLSGVTTTLTDPFLEALGGALETSTGAVVDEATSACAADAAAGHVLALDACLADVGSASGSSGHDEAVLGVMGLFFGHARGLLGL